LPKNIGGNPMESFKKLFHKFLIFYYRCFDRIVINGYIRILQNEQSVVYFFKNISKYKCITKYVLAKRTKEYQNWVDAYIHNNKIPFKWAEKNESKEDVVKTYMEKAKRKKQTGVYFIFKGMEQGNTFRSVVPKYKTKDDNFRFIRLKKSRFTHFYFYIFDPVVGNMAMRVATFFPFNTTYFLNGHSFIEQELIKKNIPFNKEDNAFISVSDTSALQAIADSLSPDIIRKRLEYWTFSLGPKFSKKERQQMNLNRTYYIGQIEYCLNFIFKRNFIIRNLFQKACQHGLITMLSDKISYVFGTKITRRLKGKLSTHLESYKHAHHVFKLCLKKAFIKQYEKLSTFLRNEVTSNNIREFGINKNLDNLPLVKEKFTSMLDRFCQFQANSFNIHFEFDIFSELSKPVLVGKSKIAGIKLQDQRVIRLMETILQSSAKTNPFKSRDMYFQLLDSFDITENDYTISQFRYDLRKLTAHGIVERIANSHLYCFTDYGIKICLNFVIFRKNVYGPILNSQFNFHPDSKLVTHSPKVERIYHKIDEDFNRLYKLLAA
jgi:hypothetical protein